MTGKPSRDTVHTVRLRLALPNIAPTVATSYILGMLDGEPQQRGGTLVVNACEAHSG